MVTSERVIAAKKGDDKAFGEIINQCKDNLYKVAYAYLKNEDEALEVVGETVYKAYMSIEKLKKPELFNTWIMKITINICINKIKKDSKIIYIDEYAKVESFNEDYEDIEINISRNLDLYKAIDTLDEKFKSIVILRYFQDMKLSDIAEVLEMPEGTVKVYLKRALKKLENELREECI